MIIAADRQGEAIQVLDLETQALEPAFPVLTNKVYVLNESGLFEYDLNSGKLPIIKGKEEEKLPLPTKDVDDYVKEIDENTAKQVMSYLDVSFKYIQELT